MKKLIRLHLCIICMMSAVSSSYAQIDYGLYPIDSVTFNFDNIDSLSRYFPNFFHLKASIDTSHTDSTNTFLWQIGNTSKYFFSDSSTVKGIMTDTLHEYPVNANSWFVLKLPEGLYNQIISFRHKYQTSSSRDGGIVEFSDDSGITWHNIMGDCPVNISFGMPGIHTSDFYSKNDTLSSGEPAFSGVSNGWMTSIFQFLWNFPAKHTGSDPCNWGSGDLYIRFRFKSDSTLDSLDGWIIGSITVNQNYYGDHVNTVNKTHILGVYPNPSSDGSYNFPALIEEKNYRIEIIDAMGAGVLNVPYTHSICLSALPKGLYFYRVSDGTEYYSGQLISE